MSVVSTEASSNAETVPGADHAVLAGLSKRELEVFFLVGNGLTNAEVAAELYIGAETVKFHVRNVLNKSGFRNRAQVAAFTARYTAARRTGADPVSVRTQMSDRDCPGTRSVAPGPCPVAASGLTDRESQIAVAVTAGATNAEIGRQLGIGTQTVKSHVRSLFRKLGLRSRAEIAAHVAATDLARGCDPCVGSTASVISFLADQAEAESEETADSPPDPGWNNAAQHGSGW